ncbi:hypothetical protein MMC07_004546 [Pseudocyphellaria aurata]|nr:hypothetical protein [Pseudocyphellaria aurata]
MEMFEYFMRIADKGRPRRHNGTIPAFDPEGDFLTDLARWNRFTPRHYDYQISILSDSMAGLVVDTAKLSDEDPSCPICMDRYTDISTSSNTAAVSSSAEDSETEPAVQLPCRHVLGRTCLAHWLQSGNLTCPVCRASVENNTATDNDNDDIID